MRLPSNVDRVKRKKRTARTLGFSPRKLGLSPNQIKGLRRKPLAAAIRRAGARLYRLAAEMENGK